MAGEAYREKNPCFVLAPQCPPREKCSNVGWDPADPTVLGDQPTWPMADAIDALVDVVASQPVDTERIYLTGLSMGGFGAWDLAMPRPDRFAAAGPIRGGGDASEVHRIAGLPLSVWHGSWNMAYGEDGCLDCMFAQRRDPVAQLAAAARLLAASLAPDDCVAFLGDLDHPGRRRERYRRRRRPEGAAEGR